MAAPTSRPRPRPRRRRWLRAAARPQRRPLVAVARLELAASQVAGWAWWRSPAALLAVSFVVVVGVVVGVVGAAIAAGNCRSIRLIGAEPRAACQGRRLASVSHSRRRRSDGPFSRSRGLFMALFQLAPAPSRRRQQQQQRRQQQQQQQRRRRRTNSRCDNNQQQHKQATSGACRSTLRPRPGRAQVSSESDDDEQPADRRAELYNIGAALAGRHLLLSCCNNLHSPSPSHSKLRRPPAS